MDPQPAGPEPATAPPAPLASTPPPPRQGARLALCLLILALGGLTWWRLRTPLPGAWDLPVASTDFAAGGWQERWLPAQPGSFEQTAAGLRTLAPGGSQLIHRFRVAVPVAVDYQAEIEPGAFPGDLSLLWSEREGVDREPWNLEIDTPRLIMVQHGAFENTHSTLRDDCGEGKVVLARDNRRLESGRTYRMRVELRRESITATLDGEVVLHSELTIPLTSGYLALYGHYPGKLFRNVRITGQSTAVASPFAAGDALLRRRHFADASAVYGAVAELQPGPVLADQAWFRKGYAERLAGNRQQSRRAWASLHDPELLARAEILQLDDLVAAGGREQAYHRFAEHWRLASAANRRILVQCWQEWLRAAIKDPAFGDAQLQALLAVRDAHFAADAVSGEVTASALLAMHRYDAVLGGYASYSQQRHQALLALGRGDEVLAGDWALSWQRAHARFVVGDMEAVLKDPYSSPGQRAMALCKLDRADEAIPLTPDRHPGLLHAGRAQELLVEAKADPESIGQALLALGREAELLAKTDAAMAKSTAYGTALRLAGRLDEAEKQGDRPLPGLRLVAALEAGKGVAEAAAALQRAYTPLIHSDISAGNWFAYAVLDTYAGWTIDGDAARAAASLREKGKLLTHDVARRPALICAVIAGDLPPERLAELPFRSEAEAWTAVATALRAELVGDRAAAAAAYARFAELPRHRRLLDDNLPNAEVERFVAWRRRILAAP